MIGKIHHVSSARASTNYDEKKKEAEKSAFLFDSFDGIDKHDRIIHLERAAALGQNPKMEKRFSHISLSLAPGTTLNKHVKKILINMYMFRMGYGGAPFIVHEHMDRPHPHFHIVASRVKNDGEVVDSKQNYYRNKTVCETLRKEFGFPSLPSNKNEKRLNDRIVHARKHGIKDLYIVQMWEKLDAAKKESYSLGDYIQNAQKRGITTRLYPNYFDPKGISYSMIGTKKDGTTVKFVATGQKLGSGYMLKNLPKEFPEWQIPGKNVFDRVPLKDNEDLESLISETVAKSNDYQSLILNLGVHNLKIENVDREENTVTFTYNNASLPFEYYDYKIIQLYLMDLVRGELDELEEKEKKHLEEVHAFANKSIKHNAMNYERREAEGFEFEPQNKLNRSM